MTRSSTSRQHRSTKSLIALACVVVLYGLAQPVLSSRLGWKLPSVMRLLGQVELTEDAGNPRVQAPPPKKQQDLENQQAGSKPATNSPLAVDDSSAGLLHGLLKETSSGSQEYISPAGLQYGKGSAEGHRLKHLERHLTDQPSRPGKHGVFYGDMPRVLRWLDDTYERGKNQEKGTQMRNEDGRTVYEVPFSKPVGYVGGRDGKRDGNPDANKIRLVVDGRRVITAFPY